MSSIEITTHNFIIRPFERKDLVKFANYRASESVARYQSWADYTYQDAIKLFESMDYATFGAAGQWYQLAISDKSNDAIVGDLAIHFIDAEQVEIGFTVAPEFQGKNVATEAISGLINYLFGCLGKHRIIATTDTRNIASYKLLEKMGFRREGHFIKNIFFKGEWSDEYQYALLRSESKII
ncbi:MULTISPECIES: GNAT family N-acetyltransferase [Pseudoalteromonas]|uniref:GNAT family protein n=1 Tax=Pseudoalteromonas obscura TaxID=3048491 RepID=A0ABT7EKG5_9GAMM|nr:MULTISPECIES: GNAT family protein [Pseudoalteromonas]MBQ4837218.1 GNAT family N-acetyltransferase [Pseudoalteromonas luteoviolacea]MDK2595556.1 GNAT family protein [Pseudoalteromonas sp. P94(2023)]